MAFISWSEKISLEVPEIDEQHKKLVELINLMYDSVVAGLERKSLAKVLDDLISYTVYHFNTEERYFIKFHYPEMEHHKQLHNSLTEKVVDLQKQFEAGSATISYEVMDFLNSWLIDHIIGTDSKFAAFIKSKGLKLS